jgi:hypothetical protein
MPTLATGLAGKGVDRRAAGIRHLWFTKISVVNHGSLRYQFLMSLSIQPDVFD